MKHICITAAALLIAAIPAIAYAQSAGRVKKCLSGDCENGRGEAIMSRSGNFSGEIHYTGTFKNGMMDGEGMAIETGNTNDHIHIGEFEHNEPSGKGSQWEIKTVNGKLVPDSSEAVIFGKWDEDDVMKGIRVYKDGRKDVYTRGHKYLNTNKVKDKWCNEQADAWIASRSGKFAAPAKPTQETLELATRTINVARDRWSECGIL